MSAVKATDIGAVVPIHRPVASPSDPFASLGEEAFEKMRTVAARVQALGLPMEVHPQLANTFSFVLDGAMYSVSVVGPREELVVSVQGQIDALTYDDLLVVLPEPGGSPQPPPMRMSPMPPTRRHQADILEEQNKILLAMLGELAILRQALVRIEEAPSPDGPVQ